MSAEKMKLAERVEAAIRRKGEGRMSINPECHIEIPADKAREAIKAAYDLSTPQGLGFLHAREGGLDDETVDAILANERPDSWIVATMDYVHGRSCKFRIYHHEGRLFIRPRWYDHGDHQLEELLTRLDVESPAEKIEAARTAQAAEDERWERENAR